MSDDEFDPALEIAGGYGDGLPPGTLLCYGQYTVDKYLNSGGFGVTYLARDSLDRKVVIKECYPNAMCCRSGEFVRLRSQSMVDDFERVVELFEKEARALAHLQHPNVVGVHQIFKDNGTAYMALDYVEGMDLLDVFEKTPEVLTQVEIVALLKALLQALSYVHENGILHRDISPDNILLDHTKTPVLIDFGAAREGATRASRILSRVHTVKDGYSPQEFYFAGSNQSPSSDLYALAATFYHLITGAPPPNSNLRLAAVAENQPDPFIPLSGHLPDFEPAFLASIDKCLNLFSKDRIESSAAWLEEIDAGRKQASAFASAAQDQDVELVIAQLVDEHKKVLAEKSKIEPAQQQAAEPEPKAEDPKAAAEREYWAILSEDPAEWRAKAIEEAKAQEVAEAKPRELKAAAEAAAKRSAELVAKATQSAKQPSGTDTPAPVAREFDLSDLKPGRTTSAAPRRFSFSSILPWSDKNRDEMHEANA